MQTTNSILENRNDFHEDTYHTVIAAYDGAKVVGQGAYGKLVKVVQRWVDDAQDIKEAFRTAEMAILNYRSVHGENVYDSKGKFIYSKVCSNSSYRSNKSVILAACQLGLPIMEDDKAVPKSKLESAIKERRVADAAPPKTDYEKALTTIETLRKIYAKLDNAAEQAEIYTRVREEIE